MELTGFQSGSPTKYRGNLPNLATIVVRSREPTSADYRDPATGKYYPQGTFWRVGRSPTSGLEGDLWYLVKISGTATWTKLGSALGNYLQTIVDASSPPGTNPVTPNVDGSITVTGGQVAAGTVGTNIIRTNSVSANAYTIEIQRATESATPDITKNGVAHFNADDFSIDADGFVSITGSFGDTLTGNVGGPINPAGGNFNIITDNATVVFSGSGSTLTQDFGLTNLVLGSDLPALTTAVRNTGMGSDVLINVTSASDNAAFGSNCLLSLTIGELNCGYGSAALRWLISGNQNNAFGKNSLFSCSTASNNCAFGESALLSCNSNDNSSFGNVSCFSLTTGTLNSVFGSNALHDCQAGDNNTAIGYSALVHVLASNNIGIGYNAGSAYASTESDNVIIGNIGIVGDSNKIRIGTSGSGAGQQNEAYIAAITGVTVAASSVVLVDANDQLSDLGFGPAAYVLTSNGAGASPTWEPTGGPGGADTITGDDAVVLAPTVGNWNIFGQQNGSIPVMQTSGSVSTLRIEDRTSTTAFVVDASSTPGQRGTFSTIQTAITAASSGTTIFVKAGTYTENLTLKAGVNLSAYGNSGMTPNVTIIGKCSFSASGTCTIYGIALQTNADYAISVTGSSTTKLFLVECNVIASNFAALQITSSVTASNITLMNSWCRTDTSSTNFFVATGGGLTFWNVNVLDDTPQNIPSTFSSSGTLNIKYSIIRFPITTSGTGRISATEAEFNTFETNSTPLVISADASAGSGFGNYLRGCTFLSGNTIALTVNQLVNMGACHLVTTGSTSISGSGEIYQSGTTYTRTNGVPSSTSLTITRQPFDAGALWGDWSGVAPAAGFVGEQIRSTRSFGSSISLSNNVNANITSITLTPGTWDVSGIVQFTSITAGTSQAGSVNDVSTTIGTYGDNTTSATFTNTNINDVGVTIPSYRYYVPFAGGNKTMYLVANTTYTSGTARGYGRISATRVT